MEIEAYIVKMRRLIAGHQLEKAIEELKKVLNGNDLYNDILQISSRYHALEKNKRGGLRLDEKIDIERNKISDSLLSLVSELESSVKNGLDENIKSQLEERIKQVLEENRKKGSDKIITGGRESKDQFLGILTWKHYLPVLFAMGIVALIFLTLAKKYIFSPDKNGAIAMQDSSINSSDNLYEIYTDTLLEGKNEVLERNKLSEDEENGVVDELKTKKMLDKICMAENYLKGRGRNADNRAIELYEATVSNLSEGTLGKMDTQLLQRASMYKSDDEETKISIQTANKFYRSIFKPYIKFCNQN